MEVKRNDNEASNSSNKMGMIRIYIGGLGENVTVDEVCRLFESVGGKGVVDAVDFVNTKGRRFAYVNFLPTSDKSLPKLFTMYNGCVWKGGRLKLEKAKEHYLLRLQREWDEDAAASASASDTDVAAKADTPSEMLAVDVHSSESNKLHIFFPHLRKVKAIPFKGTGKHKYSFQRVEVPSIPKYFCDCEEHSASFLLEKEKVVSPSQREEQTDGINEEEINIMNKVMMKFLEKQDVFSDVHNCENVVKDNTIATDENETSDEDNLIINVATNRSHEVTFLGSLGQGYHKGSENQEPTSKEKPHKDALVSHKRKDNSNKGSLNKKRKSNLNHKADENEFESTVSEDKWAIHTHSDNSGKLEAARQVDSESGRPQSMDHVTWSQKSSWKKLVGNQGNNLFNISSITPVIPSTEESQLDSDVSNVANSDGKKQNLESNEELEDSCEKKDENRLVESQPTETNVVANQSGRGAFWRQTCSWTQLVSDNSTASFSISQLLPGVTLDQKVSAETKGPYIANPTNGSLDVPVKKVQSSGRESVTTAGIGQERDVADGITSYVNPQTPIEKTQASSSLLDKRSGVAPKQTSVGNVVSGETFMRSATSLKEWSKLKSALSGSLKKKDKEKGK